MAHLLRFDGGVDAGRSTPSPARRQEGDRRDDGAQRQRVWLLAAARRSWRWRTSAAAQTMTGVPNALQGFSVNREKPVHIKSTSLEVRDKEKRATFIGNVHRRAGRHDDEAARPSTCSTTRRPIPAQPKAAQPGPGGEQQIRRLEAKGDVVVTQKEQTATGDTAIFDTTANTVTLTGNVVVTQGQNVLRGERLTVHLTTGVSFFEGDRRPVSGPVFANSAQTEIQARRLQGEPSGRIRSRERPRSDAKPVDSKPDASRSKDAARPAAKSTPGQPLRLN